MRQAPAQSKPGGWSLATGAYQRVASHPRRASSLPSGLPRLDTAGYRGPRSLPDGDVLVIGSGQSGAQIAEELRLAGRRVYLSCGRAPWVPRRWAGHDIVWWLLASGFMDQPATSLPSPAARLISNPLASGHEGGHDLDLRTLRALGVTLTGRFLGVDGGEAVFASDLAESVAWGDARYRELMSLFRKTALERGIEAPALAEPEPFDRVGRRSASISPASARPSSPAASAPTTAPGCRGRRPSTMGASPSSATVRAPSCPGLLFVGVHFLRTRKSALLMGVGEDAAAVARGIVESRSPAAA